MKGEKGMISNSKTNPQLVSIENGFKVLKENPSSNAGLELIQKSTEKIFPYTFHINVIDVKDSSPLFVMSVFPDKSTLDKIIDAISTNDNKAISKIWAQAKDWTIEIDGRILNSTIIDLTEKELTAIYCHEIGHIIYSNSIPNRLSMVLQYEIAVSSNKFLIRDKFFKKFLSLPVLNSCRVNKNESIKEEIKADKFAKKLGYQTDLISVMKKFQACPVYSEEDTPDQGMKKMARFSLNSMEQFKQRETKLVEAAIERMAANCNSIYIESVLNEILDTCFRDTDGTSMTRDKKLNMLYERASLYDQNEDIDISKYPEITLELGKQPEITEYTMDYILIKIKSIKTNDDKLMIVSYIHSKIDIVDYYLQLLKSKKRKIFGRQPYTIEQLERYRIRLLELLEMAMDSKIDTRSKINVIVSYPEGYEG